jgi:ABC-type transport system involved in multi-copper enzyme maturation permease subunit
MISLASISFLCSLYARRSRDAIVRSYLLSLGYLALSGLSWVLLWPQLHLADFPSTENWLSPVTLTDIVHWFNYGNIVSVGFQIAYGVMAGGKLNDLLWDTVTKYAWFHGVIAAGCCTWAVARLRARALVPLADNSDRRARPGRVGFGLLRDRPMLWKEIATERGGRRGLVGLFVNGCLLALLAVPVLHVVYYYGRVIAPEAGSRLTDLINLWVRGASVLLGCLLLLQVAVRAAGSVSGERGQKTFDGLLATTLDNREILAGKWLGSIFGPRRTWLGLAIVWIIGFCTGALHPLAPVCFVLAWLVYAAFLAALGLWASVANRSTHRATFWTLFVLAAALVASWLAAFDAAGRWLTEQEALGVSPPLALGLLIFSPADLKSWAEPKSEWSFRGILLGLVGWGAAAAVLWAVAKIRFRVVTGREAGLVGRAEDGSLLPVVPLPITAGQPAQRISGGNPGRGSVGPIAPLQKARPPYRLPLRHWLGRAVRITLVFLPLGLLIGEYFHLDEAADLALRDALAETDRLDPGWRLGELEAKRAIVPPEQNAALQVLKAKELVPADWWKDEQELSVGSAVPERQLSSKQFDALRKGMERVKAARVEAGRLADMLRGRFPTPVRIAGPWWDSRYPHSQETRFIGNLLMHDVDLRVQEGDADGALVSCRALLNAGLAIGDEPNFWSQQFRLGLQHDAVQKMERVLAQGEPTEANLEALQRLLADEDRYPAMLIALRGERAFADLIMQSLQESKNLTHGFLQPQRGPAAVPPLPHRDELAMIASGSLKAQRAGLLRAYSDLVQAAKLPPDKMNTRMQQVMAGLRLSSSSPAAIWFFVYPGQFQRGQQHALVRSAVAALAVERYRLQYGLWPDTLDMLVPSFLPEVPLDPHDGKRLRYRRLPDGVVIYSVGPDLTDNGGNLDRQNRLGGGTDIGVRLWDVHRRRQPAAAETPN